jgi:cob(I)alamin adenosyltransferase
VHARDRELLAGLSKVNSKIGTVTVELLTLQPDDAHYAAGLRTLAGQLMVIGAALAQRASELDENDLDPAALPQLKDLTRRLDDRTERSEP